MNRIAVTDTVPVRASAQVRRSRHVLLALLLISIAVVGWAYWPTYASIVKKWTSDTAFSHGFLILPISLWLAWQKREALATVPLVPSAVGVLAMLGCTAGWVIGRGSGVLVLEQFAAVAMIPALVIAALGWRAARVLVVPLGFLIFLVPFGRGLVPFLMHATAYFSTLLLQWSGVPVFRTYMEINIPAGNFEVARACSGLNYFVTSLVLGALYAYLMYRGWLKRLICVVAFVWIPVALNILRVYLTILVSHLTDLRFGPGTEHVMFGRIFFVLMMLVMFWIGRRWQDADVSPSVHAVGSVPNAASGSWFSAWPLALTCMIAVAAPPFVQASVERARAGLVDVQGLIHFPAAAGWNGPLDMDGKARWRPLYHGGVVERQARYSGAGNVSVDVFVAVYGLGITGGAEMISSSNVISPEERGRLSQDVRRRVQSEGSSLVVRELIVPDRSSRRLVWQWFVIGKHVVDNEFAAKAWEATAFITGNADSERVVVISTPMDDQARQRLEAFVQAHGKCVVTGFTGEACGT